MAASSLDHRYLRRSLWLLGVALLMLVLTMVLFVVESRKIIAHNDELNRINALLPSLRSTLELMLDAETGQRGYLLTRNSEYLEPYRLANAQIDSVLAEVRSAVDDYGPEWVAQIEGLIDLKRQKFSEMGQTLLFADKGDAEAAMGILRQNNGLVLMDQARGVLDSMIDELRIKRDSLMKRNNRALLRAQILIIAVTIVLVGIVAFATWLLIRILRENDALQGRLEQEATHDVLTGLPNRRLLDELLPTLVEQARRRSSILGILYFDLDGFKRVNDELGHAAGDSVLRLVADRAFNVVRQSDVLARLGGDEFAVVVPDVGSRGALLALAQRLLKSLSEPMPDDLQRYPIGASIGIAMFPQQAESADQLMFVADSAMYVAKRGGKGRVCFAGEDTGKVIA